MSSVEQQMATDSNELRPVGGTLRAIVQDRYGKTPDILRLEEIDLPHVGDEGALSASRQPASTSVTGTSWRACRTCYGWWASDSRTQGPGTRH